MSIFSFLPVVIYRFKRLLFFLWFACIGNILLIAQTAPSIEWQRAMGSYSDDLANAVYPTPDSGYIVSGIAQFRDSGDVTDNHGIGDFWLVKFGQNGNVEWKKSFGGTDSEMPYDLRLTSDSGYIVVGTAYSNDGDVTATQADGNWWIVKISRSGNIQWQKTYGGSRFEYAKSVELASDGGYIIAGGTLSSNGDVTGGGNGLYDGWVVKLNSEGTLVWQTALGGTQNDEFLSIVPAADGGYIAAGFTYSTNGAFSSNHGSSDWWIVKFSSAGTVEWQKFIGGTQYEQAYSIRPAPGGGYIVGGYTASANGDVSGNHGGLDCWLVRLSESGNILWQKCLGGSSFEQVKCVRSTADGGYIMTGYTFSNDMDVSGNHSTNASASDMWVIKTDSLVNIQWQQCYGGSRSETGYAIEPAGDGFIVVGNTNSADGDVTGYHDDNVIHFGDYWIVKLSLRPAITAYTFTGNGYWNDPSNWQGGSIPPALITTAIQVNIDPAPGGECMVNVPVTISHQSSLIVKPGAKLVVSGNLQINNQ